MPTTLVGLHPYVKERAEKLLINANKRLTKYKMIITQAYRSKEEQDALYKKGRRGIPGEKIVTNAKGGQSMHNYGLAIDFALVDPTGKKAVWNTTADFDNDGLADWTEVVAEAKKLSFEWGGDWRGFKDCPHFQMTGGLTDKEVISGKKPVFIKEPVKQPVKKPVSKDIVPYPGKALKIGSKGKNVDRIRHALKLNKTGEFDAELQKAVKEYQKRKNLVSDGVVGEKTWSMLF